MTSLNKLKLVFASALAALLAIIFVVIITIWAELFASLKNWLTNLSGHHWTSKSLLSVAVYLIALFILYLVITPPGDRRLRQALISLVAGTLVGVLVLTLFYTGHYYKFY
ncbi:MAG: hypothetical protein AAB647_01030 [Patescibacteria group bacterium]